MSKNKEQKEISYRDMSDNLLILKRNAFMDYIEENKTLVFVSKFHELLEIERELTLREGR